MNDDSGLEPGAMGRLVILISEVHALKAEAVRLASGAEQILGELVPQRQVHADLFELTVRVHDMLASLFQQPEPAQKPGHNGDSEGMEESQPEVVEAAKQLRESAKVPSEPASGPDPELAAHSVAEKR